MVVINLIKWFSDLIFIFLMMENYTKANDLAQHGLGYTIAFDNYDIVLVKVINWSTIPNVQYICFERKEKQCKFYGWRCIK